MKRESRTRYIRRPRAWLVSLAAAVAVIGITTTLAVASPLPTQAPNGAKNASISDNNEVRLVTTVLRVAFTDHQVDQIDKYFSPDFVQHSPLVSDPGREGLKQWLTRALESIPELRYSSDQVLVDHNRVITFSTVTETIEKDMPRAGHQGKQSDAEYWNGAYLPSARQPDRRALGNCGHRAVGAVRF
jgi:predicted SnoaL-like aldol condensation-catalyzing enzyme